MAGRKVALTHHYLVTVPVHDLCKQDNCRLLISHLIRLVIISMGNYCQVRIGLAVSSLSS